ncbi:MAG: YfhO family protein [Deltaproteobacteria bacterium]|nr:YfhO family protein [Deltaproteobacteria bacterium]
MALGAAVLLALLLGAAFYGVLFGNRTLSAAAWVPGVLPSGPVGSPVPLARPPMRDVEGAAWVDEPAPYLVHRGLTGNGLLWNDAEGLGLPLLGNPNMGALTPLQLPMNLAPSPWMQDLTWLGRAWLLGFFTYLLARGLGLRPLASVGAASALMLSGQTTLWMEHHPLNTDVFVPAALLAALGVRAHGRRRIALLALAIGLGLLAVKPQSAVVAGLFGFVWLLAASRDHAPDAPVRARVREVAGWSVGLALGLGLAAVALLPSLETYRGASGLVQVGRTTQSAVTLPLERLSTLAGDVATGLQRLLTEGQAGRADAAAGLPHAGLTVVAGAALGFWRARGRWLARALGATVVLELLRIHGLLPIPFGDVPILSGVNFVKYCFPLYLALALLLGLALDSARTGRAAAGLALVVAELLWLVPRDFAPRVDPYAPAPWVEALRDLERQRPGRISGPVQLAPPLVSAALGLRDLRSIDVLTPRATVDLVGRFVAPSQGVTWILADPDPLLAATAPAANVTNLRWIAARSPLAAADLPAAVRAMTTSRRLQRLFGDLRGLELDTRSLGAGLHDGGKDRRFHWICETPCRFVFELARLPRHFATGIAAPEPASLRVRFSATGTHAGGELHETIPADSGWHDLWLPVGDASPGPGTVTLEVDSDAPAKVFVGGVGPAAAPDVEAEREAKELAWRASAFARLEPRWQDEVAHLYENPGALGEAYLATLVQVGDGTRGVVDCLREHPGEAVACLERGERADAFPVGSGTISVFARHADRLVLTTETAGPATLVVSRLFTRGWKATIDGAPTPFVRANEALLALAVPAGKHEVALVYDPSSVRFGLAASALSLLVCATLLVLPRRR